MYDFKNEDLLALGVQDRERRGEWGLDQSRVVPRKKVGDLRL